MVSAMALSPVPEKPKGRLPALIGVSAASALIAMVAVWEGKSNVPYSDVIGVMTVCYGETQMPMRRYSDAECKAMLSDRLADYAGPVLRRNPELRGHDSQVVAASSLAYNIGPGAVCNSSIPDKVRAGQYEAACLTIGQFVCGPATEATRAKPGEKCYSKKKAMKVLRGLENRRKEEVALCLS